MRRIAGTTFGLTALLGVSLAHATTVTTGFQTVTFGPGYTDFSNASQALNLFDSSLGTLQSVTIEGTYGFNSTVTITNNAATASSGNSKTESASAFGSSTSAINGVIETVMDKTSAAIGSTPLNPAAFDLTGAPVLYSLAAGGATTGSSNEATQSTGQLVDSNSSDLTAFSTPGGGTFNVLFNTLTGTTLSNTGGNTSSSQVTTATGTFAIAYTYNTPPTTPVPEPASVLLLGVGVVGMGAVRARRKA